jgi:DNA-binding transcriptional LysR family regulator
VTNIGTSERLLTDIFAEAGLTPDIRIRTNSINQVMSLAYVHPLLCILPEQSIVDDLADGRLVRVDQDFIASQANIVVLNSNLAERTSSMRTFLRLCAEQIPKPFEADAA